MIREADDLPISSESSSSSTSSTQSLQPVAQSTHPSESEPDRDQYQEMAPVNAFFMVVTGIQVDTVTEVTSRIPPGLLTQECLQMGGCNGFGDVPEELWRTLVAGRGPDGGNPPGWYHCVCSSCFDLGSSSGDVDMKSLITDPKTPSLMVEFLKRVQGIVWNRLFVRSKERKLFGLGPKGTQKGDLVCILYGCSVPVILRPHMAAYSSKIEYYEIVGESYIYGMMDGEAVSKVEPETGTKEFKLG